MDPTEENYLMHVVSLSLGSKMIIHPPMETQIALSVGKEMTIPAKYLDYTNVFLKESVAELPKSSDINEYSINLEPGIQLPSSLIYSLELIELETLKTYIETNLTTSFIPPFKSPARAAIIFVQKTDGSLCLYVDY